MADFSTCDLVDAFKATGRIQSCTVQFKQFGGKQAFAGPIRTVTSFEDNALIKRTLSEPGNGGVLVVDGGGSLRMAVCGDKIAKIAIDSGWSGLVLWTVVRDVDTLKSMPIGIKALGSNPWNARKEGSGFVDLPVTFVDATFKPGGWVYSDNDGIIVADGKLI